MTRSRRWWAAALACTLSLTALGASGAATAKPKKKGKPKPRFYDLGKAPVPDITGGEIIAGLEEFVEMFPLRSQGSPTNLAAAEFLRAEAEENGFTSQILEMQTNSIAPNEETALVVEAIKKGTTRPDEWIAFVSHYDTVPGLMVTVQGAYDDGSGTNMMRFFGEAFSKIKTNRSIVLLWFDGEENGLLGSQAYVDMLEERGQKVHAALGFDMVGIGYPAPYCICIYHGPNIPKDLIALPIIDYVNFDFLGFPEGDGGTAPETMTGGTGHVCNCGVNIRNSDEQNFAEKGWFTIRWTGMRTASDYLGYHQPWDTVPFMEATARSRANLEQGTENTFLSAYYTALVVDHLL
jgi:hypothetical protein